MHCRKRFRGPDGKNDNPLRSMCNNMRCYESGPCSPIVIESHLTRSYLFYGQIYASLISVLPLRTDLGPNLQEVLLKISDAQGGFRHAQQIDHTYILRNMRKLFILLQFQFHEFEIIHHKRYRLNSCI